MNTIEFSQISRETLEQLVRETNEYMNQYTVGFGIESADEFRRRLDFDINSCISRPMDPIDLARYRVIAEAQKEVSEPENAIILKAVVTKDGIKLL